MDPINCSASKRRRYNFTCDCEVCAMRLCSYNLDSPTKNTRSLWLTFHCCILGAGESNPNSAQTSFPDPCFRTFHSTSTSILDFHLRLRQSTLLHTQDSCSVLQQAYSDTSIILSVKNFGPTRRYGPTRHFLDSCGSRYVLMLVFTS